MSVYCPNNGITYSNIRLWMDSVRDTDFGEIAIAYVDESEVYSGINPLHFVGSWPKGFRLESAKPFNGIYTEQSITTLTFEGPDSIIIDINSGTLNNDKVCEITGFIIKHRGQGIDLRDNRDYLDVRIHENFIRSIGNDSYSTWIGTNNIVGLTHSLTTSLSIENNILYGAAREAIKVYMNDSGNVNLGINNNVMFNTGLEADAYSSVLVQGLGQVDLVNNVMFPSGLGALSVPYNLENATPGSVYNNASVKAPADIIAVASETFVDMVALDFRIKTGCPAQLAAPNIGAFKQRVTGVIEPYSVSIEYTDFTQAALTYKQGTIDSYFLNLTINQEGDLVAQGYTRQSVFDEGDVILAEHGNLEFDQLSKTFDKTEGHRHDGTEGNGGLIGKIGNPDGSMYMTISSQGVLGNVVMDDDLFLQASPFRLPTQRSVKNYVLNRTSAEFTKQQLLSNPNTNTLSDEQLQQVLQLPPVGSDLLVPPPIDGKTYAQRDGEWKEIPQSIENLTLGTNNVSKLRGTNTSGGDVDLMYVDEQDNVQAGDVANNFNIRGLSLTYNTNNRIYNDDNFTFRVFNDQADGDIILPSRYKECTVVIADKTNNIILNKAAKVNDVVIVHKLTQAGEVTITGSVGKIYRDSTRDIQGESKFPVGVSGSAMLICTSNPDGLSASWFIQQN